MCHPYVSAYVYTCVYACVIMCNMTRPLTQPTTNNNAHTCVIESAWYMTYLWVCMDNECVPQLIYR